VERNFAREAAQVEKLLSLRKGRLHNKNKLPLTKDQPSMAENSKYLIYSVCSASGLNSQKFYRSEKCQVGLSITYFKNYHIKHAVQSPQDVDAHYETFTTNMSKKMHIFIFIIRYLSSTLGFIFKILNMYNNHQSGKIFMKIQDVCSSFQCISSNKSWHIMVFTEQGIILKPPKLISNFQKCSVRIRRSWNS